MKVSIVTVVYNGEATLETAIRSVQSQSYPDIEYIVVDGASKDGTMAIINKYEGRVDVLVSEPDDGLYFAMNKGLKLATGDLIGTLNADDFYSHEHVIRDVVKMIKEKNVDSIYADLVYVDPVDLRVNRYWKSAPYKRWDFLFGFMPPHPTFFIRRKCYEKYGYFDTRLFSSADYELMLRHLYKNRVSCAYLPEITIVMRAGGQSNASLGNRLKANYEDFRSWFLNSILPLPFTSILKFMRKLPQFNRAPGKDLEEKYMRLWKEASHE